MPKRDILFEISMRFGPEISRLRCATRPLIRVIVCHRVGRPKATRPTWCLRWIMNLEMRADAEALVKERMAAYDSSHDWHHVDRVRNQGTLGPYLTNR